MHRSIRIATVAALSAAAMALGLLTAAVQADDATARATLRNAAGNDLGVVKFIQQGDRVLVKADALSFGDDASPGFKGFHIHSVGSCVAPAFTSAGGHWVGGGGGHGTHDGDMPVLLVDADRSAWSRFKTDRITVAEVIGKAVIVHAGPDNYANIPTRYQSGGVPGPDAATLATGDAGARYACGVIEATD